MFTVKPNFQTIGISIITSVLVSGVSFFVYSRKDFLVPKKEVPKEASTKPNEKPTPTTTVLPMTVASTTTQKDENFAKYESIINAFLDAIKKGNVESAYASTAPTFQKITSLQKFQDLVNEFKAKNSIASQPCSVTEYSNPYKSTLENIAGEFSIVQAKCEAVEGAQIKGFVFEFIDDKGKAKISYVNSYTSILLHKRE